MLPVMAADYARAGPRRALATYQAARLLQQGQLVTIPEASHATSWTHPDELAAVAAPFLRGGPLPRRNDA